MQNLTEIPSSEKLVDSRARINNNFISVQSNFSGTTFPTVSIEVGQTCFRTDLAQKFELKSVNPNVWILIADLNKTYTNKEYVDTQDALKMPKAGGTFTGSVYGLTPIKGATTKELATMEALDAGLSDKADTADLAPVATSGSYTDLADKPTISIVGGTGIYNDLINKPTIPSATVATTGSYNDLLNKPIIPSAGNTVSITAGTIAHGGTIPLPSGYTREQCKYAVWSVGWTYNTHDLAINVDCSVNQSTGVVTSRGRTEWDWDGTPTWNDYVNITAGYLCIGVK